MLAIDDYGEDEDYLGQVVDDYLNEDNIQAKNNVIRNATLNCMELNYSMADNPIPENYTDGSWIEWGANIADLTQTSTRSTWTNLAQTDEAILTKDKDHLGNYFDDFTHNFTFCMTDIGAAVTATRLYIWSLSNFTNDSRWHVIGVHDFLSLQIRGNVDNLYYFRLVEFHAGAVFSDTSALTFSEDVVYYIGIVKNDLSFIVEIYTDSLYQNLRERISLTLQDDYVFRYVYSPQSLDFLSNGNTVNGYVENLYIGRMEGIGQYVNGHYYTVEMLDGDRGIVLMYNVTTPEDTGMTMEFSSDNATWLDHNKDPGSDTLIEGFESLDLRDLNFTALYTRVNMTSLGENTPRIYQFRLVTITDVTLENVTGTWVDYNFTSIVTVVGDNVTGFLNSTYFKDGDFYSVTEVTGAPGYDIRFNVTGLPDNLICLCLDLFMYYDGSGGHTFQIEVWNFTDSNWDFIEDIPDECCRWFNNTLECIPDDYVQNGTLVGRLYHPSPGNVNHVWGLDYGKLRVYVPYEVDCEEVPALSAMDKYYALAIMLLILGLLIGIGIRRRR